MAATGGFLNERSKQEEGLRRFAGNKAPNGSFDCVDDNDPRYAWEENDNDQ